jgi:hypothetical protein
MKACIEHSYHLFLASSPNSTQLLILGFAQHCP